MCSDDGLHVGHASIAYFQVISVKYFVIFVLLREMFVYQLQKYFGDVGFNVVAEGWIEPYNISVSVFRSLVVTGLWVVYELIVVIAVF